MTLLPMTLKNGARFYVEVDADADAPAAEDDGVGPQGPAMGGRTARKLAETHFAGAVKVVEGVAAEVTEGLVKKEDGSRRLSEVALEIALGFDAEGNVFFASGKASATLKLNLKWTIPPPPTPPKGG
jgi:Trypsin-co-occurring domain 1